MIYPTDRYGNPLPSVAVTGSAGQDPATESTLGSINTKLAGTIKVNGSATVQPISGSVAITNLPVTQPVSIASLPLASGAATATNQGLANISLASIDNKLTSPLSITPTQQPNPWFHSGDVATASTAQAIVMRTSFTYTGSNVYGYIASNSANDTLAGTGAQKITITYFKADGSGPFTETDNLQGLTGIYTANTMAFIQSVVVSQVGSGGTNVGTILVSNLSPLSTMASINPGDSETYYCHHIVPLGKTAYITDFLFGSATTSAGQGGRFFVKKQALPQSSNAVLNAAGTMALVGTSSTQNILLSPIKIVGPSLITVQLIPDSATANTFYASMGGYEI